MPRLSGASSAGAVLAVATLIPLQAMAHPVVVATSPFGSGFFHSFSGLDHALAMVAVGALSTKLLRPDILLLPFTFLVFLGAGAAAGYFGLDVRFVETAIAASCLVLGSCILSNRLQRYRALIFVVVGGFATAHGYAHLIELPMGASPDQFTLGFLSAAVTMHATGVFIGEAFKDDDHLWLMRLLGSAMLVFGALFMVRRLQAGTAG